MPIPVTPSFLQNIIGYSADASIIPATTPSGSGALSYQSAFPPITSLPLSAGGVAPSREDFNGVFKLLSQHTFFQQSGGVYPWSNSLDYPVGAHVLGSNMTEYVAVSPSGPDYSGAVDPTTDTTGANWRSIVLSSPGQDSGSTSLQTILYVDYTASESGTGTTESSPFKNLTDCFAAINKYPTTAALYNASTWTPSYMVNISGTNSTTIEISNICMQGADITLNFSNNFILSGMLLIYNATCVIQGTGSLTINNGLYLQSSNVYIHNSVNVNTTTTANPIYSANSFISVNSGATLSTTSANPLSISSSQINIDGAMTVEPTTSPAMTTEHMIANTDFFINYSGSLTIDSNKPGGNSGGCCWLLGCIIRGYGSFAIAGPLFLGSNAQIYGSLYLGSKFLAPSYGIVLRGGYVSLLGNVYQYNNVPGTKGIIGGGGTIESVIAQNTWPGTNQWIVSGNGFFGTP